MRCKEKRIPVHLEFSDSAVQKEDFLARLKRTELFAILCDAEKYFDTISDALLSNEDPSNFIADYEPEHGGSSPFKVIPASSPIDTSDIVFIYKSDMTEDEFGETAKSISERILKKHSSVIPEYSGFKFYRWYLETDPNSRRALADAYFYGGAFSKAGPIYEGIRKSCSPYAARMAEWCGILSGESRSAHYSIFDILILNKNHDALFNCLNSLDDRRKTGVECWLAEQNMSPKRALLNLYLCARDLSIMRNTQKLKPMLERIEKYTSAMANDPLNERNELWKNVWQRISMEIESA